MSRTTFLFLSCTLLSGASLLVSTGCSHSDPIDQGSSGGSSDVGGSPEGDGGAEPTGDGGMGGSGGASGVCPQATGTYPVEPAASNLVFLLDRSGSMHLRVGSGGETRWTLTTAGLANLVASIPDDTVAGLAMFPGGDAPIGSCCEVTADNYIDCTCGAGELPDPTSRCDASTYGSLLVPPQALSTAQDEAIIGAVAASDEEFYWGTPLAPALGGTLEAATSEALPGVTSVVLLTDGLPTSCDTAADPSANDLQRALDAAASGLAGGVRTYVVGIDAEAASSDPATDLAINLSQLAMAGGSAAYPGCEATSDCAYRVNVDNFEQGLADALDSIALEAASCTFVLPQPDGGEPDYDAVNITVTADGDTQPIPRDVSHSDGWDYTPAKDKVQLYGAACEQLKADASAQIEVVVGCSTIEN